MTTGDITGSSTLMQTTVSGVPTFVVETGRTPAVELTFRTGIADEELVGHGQLHLLEHLAMHGVDSPAYECNASVGLWTTSFQAVGDWPDLLRFLERVTSWLSDPDFGDLDHERRILQAESARRGYSEGAFHLDLRYGARGVGLPNYPELGLRRTDEASLRRLLATCFTADNAVLACAGTPPAEARLHLPRGERLAIPQVRPLPLSLPCHTASGSPYVTVSGILHDATLSALVAELLSRRVTAALRHELAASYATTTTLERVDNDSLVLVLVSDVAQEHAAQAVETVRRALQASHDDGPTTDEIDAIRIKALRALGDDPTGVWQAFSSAHLHLRGAPPVTRDVVQNRYEGASPSEFAQEIRTFLATAIYSSPAGKDSSTSMRFDEGVRHRRAHPDSVSVRPWRASDPSRLLLSPSTVEIRGTEHHRGVALDELAAYLEYPDGARTLVAVDGNSLHLEPGLWHRADEAILTLDTYVNDDVRIPMESRETEEVVEPPAGWRRSWAQVRLFLASVGGRIVATVVLCLLAAAAVWGAVHGHGGGLGLLVAGFWLYKLWAPKDE